MKIYQFPSLYIHSEITDYKMTFVQESPEFKIHTDSCYCFRCGARNEALIDSYAFRYGHGGTNLKGLEWSNFNKMTGSGLTTKCSSCNDIIYRIRILEERSPTIKSAKLQKKPVQDIGYFARARQIEEISMFGSENVTKVGSGPKPVPTSEVPVKDYLTGSLKSITYHQPPSIRIYCPVCSATAQWQRSERPSEANLFCRHCQLQYKAETYDNRPFQNVLLNR